MVYLNKDFIEISIVLINLKSGVMGSWTPGLLNANQALYQLSYNPSYNQV